MRIALLLSGQPRFIEEGSEYILKNICEGNNVDTFCHFWMDDGLITKPYKFGGAGGWVHQRIDSKACLLYTSPSPRDRSVSRMPSSA